MASVISLSRFGNSNNNFSLFWKSPLVSNGRPCLYYYYSVYTNNSVPTSANFLLYRNKSMPIVTAVIAHRHFKPSEIRAQSYCSTGALSLQTQRSFLGKSSCKGSFVTSTLPYQGMTKPCPVFTTADVVHRSVSSTSSRQLSSVGIFAKTKLSRCVDPLSMSPGQQRRFFAKGKDKPKGKKAVVVVNLEEMKELINYDAFYGQLESLMEEMKDEFTKQLSVRGASGALENLLVEFEGEKYPLQELAQVGRKNPQMAVLNLASLPDACMPVIKAIQDCGMNLNPQQEGTTIYVPLPKVTREHREQLSKNAKNLFNKYKTNFQSIQNRYVKQCKSKKDVSEDLSFSVQQQILKITDNFVTDAEKLMKLKQKELLDS